MATPPMRVRGGPELVAALHRVSKKLASGPATIEVLKAGGRKVADEWARRVPIGEAPHDPHPGAYRRAMESPDSVYVDASDPAGTRVYVRPANLTDLDIRDQPRWYAGRLEFGDASRSPEPSARAAAESSKAEVIQIVSAGISRVVKTL